MGRYAVLSRRTDVLLDVLRCGKKMVITGHDAPDVDSLLSCALMQRFLARVGIESCVALMTPADEQSSRIADHLGVDVQAMYGEIKPDDSLILLDHHRPQHGGCVLACIDHHPTDFAPDAPFVWIVQSGACAAMVYNLMEAAGMPVTPEDEKLAVAALYLDTLALRSTKILPQEAQWAKERAAVLRMDAAWLEKEGLGLQDPALPAPVLAMTGKKRFVYGSKVVFSTYVQLDGMEDGLRASLLRVLKAALVENGADLWVFLHHDPAAMRSVEYDIWPDGTVETIGYDHLVSRGKDVMPRIERRMREQDGCKA